MEKKAYMYRPSDYSVYTKRSDGRFVPIDCSDMEGLRGFEEDLLRSHGFVECEEDDLATLKEKKTEHYAFLSWYCRPDGHGGRKGGTIEEYREHLKRKLPPRFSREVEYKGFTDPTVIEITDELDRLSARKKVLREKLEEIRSNCEHDYRFWCRGMHKDVYYCSKCGESREH
jgi:hypothetical protein